MFPEHQPDLDEEEKMRILKAGFEPSDRALLDAVKGYQGCGLSGHRCVETEGELA